MNFIIIIIFFKIKVIIVYKLLNKSIIIIFKYLFFKELNKSK